MDQPNNFQQLLERMQIEDDLHLMAFIDEVKKDIQYWNTRYILRTQEKNYALADQINLIIRILQENLQNVTRTARNNTCEVSQTSAAGNKRVFIIQR